MDLIIIAIFAAIVLLGLAAQRWGVDSRPIDADPRYPATFGGLG